MGIRVAVITTHDSPNYGSCLQAYATQVLLEKLGCNVTMINYIREQSIPRNAVNRILSKGQYAKDIPLLKLAPIRAAAKLPILWLVKQREKPLNDFRHKWLNLSENRYSSEEELEENPPRADIYCAGSDQIWNSDWNDGFSNPYYLKFAPKGSKKIAFASSIGKESFDEWEVPLVHEALTSFTSVSVREKSAIRALERIGINGAVHVLDPTLMLTAADWSEVAGDACPEEPYILVYQLNKNPRMTDFVSEASRESGLPAYRIVYGIHEKAGECKPVVCPSVELFLSLFMNAKFVITDSFHGTAFSVNLNKQFATFVPSHFGGRITDFASMFGLEDRIVDNDSSAELLERQIEFGQVNAILEKKRIATLEYLEKALVNRR